MSELMFIAVPGGTGTTAGARSALLRVLISPNLTGSSLAADGMEQWPPPSLVGATLMVDFSGTPDDERFAVAARPPHIKAQPGLWQAFFGSDTVVTRRLLRSAASREVDVDSTSAKAAAIAATFAKAAAVELRLDHDDRPALDAVVRRELIERWSGPEPASAPMGPLMAPPGFKVPNFHQTIGTLREHPHVLRALGLIIEIALPVAALPLDNGVLRVRWPDAPNNLPLIVSPWTQFSPNFLPGNPTLLSSGMVALTGGEPGTAGNWSVVTVDVDNGAKRLREAAKAAAAAPADPAPGNLARPFLLPALRSSGIALVRPGRQADFKSRRKKTDAFTQSAITDIVLDADDLVLGYRIDIKPQGRTGCRCTSVRPVTGSPARRDHQDRSASRAGGRTHQGSCRRRSRGRPTSHGRDRGPLERLEPCRRAAEPGRAV